MAIKKSDLYSSLWASCDELRGGMDAKRAVKEQEAALDRLAYEKYPTLTEAEIKMLVVDDKWMARLSAAVSKSGIGQ